VLTTIIVRGSFNCQTVHYSQSLRSHLSINIRATGGIHSTVATDNTQDFLKEVLGVAGVGNVGDDVEGYREYERGEEEPQVDIQRRRGGEGKSDGESNALPKSL